MATIHSIMSGDGTICLVVDGKHYTISVTHPSYEEIRKQVQARPMDELLLLKLLDINNCVSSLNEGNVRISLDEGKVWYNDTEFHDKAFCERILRLMSEGQDVQYLVNFLNNLGQNPEFRAIMETFKFICNEGMPITPDGCFLGYKGVRNDYMDRYSGSMDNTPDGRRMDYPREKVNSNPNNSCAQGLHVGSYNYAKRWGERVVLVKVNPKDVVSVPNHDCEKMRVCGYWVIRDFSQETDMSVLQGEVYDSEGCRVPSQKYVDMAKQGQFDNDANTHWDEEEGRVYGNNDTIRDDGVCSCPDCDCLIGDCICDDKWDAICEECNELIDDCECYEDVCEDCGEHFNSCTCYYTG